MKPQPFIIGLCFALVVLYVVLKKLKNQKSQVDEDTTRPLEELFPTQLENDKLVIVDDISIPDLRTIVSGFCNLYNKKKYQARPRLTKITETRFAITFPFDIDFEIFCYFINYVHYPIGFEKSFSVTAWATIKSPDSWIPKKCADKKGMLFIPPDDTEYENVYITTSDNVGFKLGFAVGGTRQLDKPKLHFTSPVIDIKEIASKRYEDFK